MEPTQFLGLMAIVLSAFFAGFAVGALAAKRAQRGSAQTPRCPVCFAPADSVRDVDGVYYRCSRCDLLCYGRYEDGTWLP